MKNTFIRNSMIFALAAGLLLMADLLIKHYAFEYPGKDDVSGLSQHDWKAIGIRSYAHTNSTLLSFLKFDISKTIKILINALVIAFIISLLMFSKSKVNAIALSIISAGILGNTFDTIVFNYVRDVLYTPWLDRGTFNPADLFIVIGAITLSLNLLKEVFKKENRKVL